MRQVRKVSLTAGFTCPNIDGTKSSGGCIYCNNNAFSPAMKLKGESVTAQLEKQIPFMEKRYRARKFIAYFQSFSNTYGEVEHLEALYREALQHPKVIGLSIGTRPDCLNKEVVNLLHEISKEYYVALEVGLQTSHDETLAGINRCHTFLDFQNAMSLCQGTNIITGTHIILGLPGEGPSHWNETALALSKIQYQTLKITPLYVVKSTSLQKSYEKGEYEPLDQSTYVKGVVDFLERTPSNVGIQRITGSVPRDVLLAPSWCRDQAGTTEKIIKEFELRNTCQGKLLSTMDCK